MGRVRAFPFDAVVGVGSLNPWRDSAEIAGKVTWVGLGPETDGQNRPLVRFRRFVLLDGNGPLLSSYSADLYNRFYVRNARIAMNSFCEKESSDLSRIVDELLNRPEAGESISFEEFFRTKEASRDCRGMSKERANDTAAPDVQDTCRTC